MLYRETFYYIDMNKQIFFALLAGVCMSVQAQNSDVSKEVETDEVVVTGTRNSTDIRHLPMTITTVNHLKLTESHRTSVLPTLTEQVPYSRVAYKAETDKPVSAEVAFDIVPAGEGSQLKGHADIQVPFFLQGMVKGAIDKFMGTAMQYLKTAIENS